MTSPSHVPNKLDVESPHRAWWLALGVSFATALLIISPFFRLGVASGHDISFHASSWLDAANQWKEGIIYPRWTEWANYGFGEPRFVFYPPLSWMLGAALSLVLRGNAVPGAFIFLSQTLAGLSMFALARRFLSRSAALFAAACYAANPYALLIVYMRSDFAEELAAVFLPVLLLAALQVGGLIENSWRSPRRAIAVFALLFGATWLSNAPAGVMASYSMALLFAWAAFRGKSFAPLWRGAAGLALGFGLTSFYLLPAAYEQRWVNIAQALSSGLQPSQNFLYTQINDPEHNLFNWIASSIAVLLILLAGIASVVAKRSVENSEASEEARRVWQTLLLLSGAATILMLRPSSLLWDYLPKLQFVQFPWRWMGILAVPYAYFAAATIARKQIGWIGAAIVLLAVASTGVYLVHKTWWDADDIPALQEAIAKGQGFEGADEYDPIGDDRYNLPPNAVAVRILRTEASNGNAPTARVDIQRWTAEEKVVAVSSREPVRVALRLLDYPAWRVELNGSRVKPEHGESTSEMVFRLPAGLNRITARFAHTPDRTSGDVLSLGSLLALSVVAFARTRLSQESAHR